MRELWRGAFVILGIVAMLAIQAGAREWRAPTPPSQPATGPGGSGYNHAAVRKTLRGEEALQFWVFEPAEPHAAAAPVVVFTHGWGATNPRAYGAWIDHIVRRGNIVVYPVYQKPGSWRYPPQLITPNAICGCPDGLLAAATRPPVAAAAEARLPRPPIGALRLHAAEP